MWSSREKIKASEREIQHTYRTNFIRRVQELLDITDYTIYTEKVSRDQVTADDGNREFVGICVNQEEKICFLYHTRDLTDEDVVHELIHVAYPEFTEEEVSISTARLLGTIGIR